jgi:hypothetical protein
VSTLQNILYNLTNSKDPNDWFNQGVMGIPPASATKTVVSAKTYAAMQNNVMLLHLIDIDDPNANLLDGTKKASDYYYYFRNTPDDIVDTRPARSSVTPTRGGMWLEDFGSGIREISLKGHTGFKKMRWVNSTEELDGKQLMERLAELIMVYRQERVNRVNNGGNLRSLLMVFHYFMNNVNVIVHPMQFRILQSKSSPLLYSYEITFTVLGEYTDLNINMESDPASYYLANPEERAMMIYQKLLSLLVGDFVAGLSMQTLTGIQSNSKLDIRNIPEIKSAIGFSWGVLMQLGVQLGVFSVGVTKSLVDFIAYIFTTYNSRTHIPTITETKDLERIWIMNKTE